MSTTRPVASTGVPGGVSGYRAGLSLAVVIAGQLMFVLDTTVVNVALPKMQHDLGFSTSGLSWVLNSYTLTFGGLLLLGGRAGDILGRRRTFVFGVALFTVASLLGGVAGSAWWMLAARAGQGVGAAAASPGTLAIIASTFTGDRKTRAIALYTSVSAAGASIGLILGGVLTSLISWRWVFFINVPIGLFAVVVGVLVIRETPRHPGRVDIAGAITSTVGMTSLVYGFIRAASDGWADALTVVSFVVAIVVLAGFFVVESRAERPIMPLRLLLSRNRGGAYLDIVFLSATMFGMFFFLIQILQNVLTFTPIGSGLAFLPLTVVLFVAARFVAKVAKRTEPKALMLGGGVCLAAGAAWLTQVSVSSTYVGAILGPMVLFGIGMGLCFVPLNITIMSEVAKTESGAASGMLQTVQQVGGSLGLAILVNVFGSAGGDTSGRDKEALLHGITTAFVGATVFMVCAIAIIVFVIRSRRRPAEVPSGH